MKARMFFSICMWLCLSATVSNLANAALSAPAPANDNFADAREIPLNKNIKINALESATLEIGEPATCPMENSVWFKFTALFDGSVGMTTVGSVMMRGTANFDSDTLIEVYTGTDLATLTPLECADEDSAEIAEIDELDIFEGVTYYIRVGAQVETISGPLIAPSYLKFTVFIRNASDWGVNSQQMDFEGSTLTAWSLRSARNGDGLICGTAEAFEDACAVKLFGGANEKTKLVQTFVWPYQQVAGRNTHYLEFSVNLNIASTDPRVKMLVVINYGKNKPSSRSKVVIKADTGGVYKNYEVFAYFSNPKVKSVSLIIQNRSTDGTVLVDGAYLDYDGGLLRAATLLPVPAISQ